MPYSLRISLRIIRREWRRYLLPLFSLFLTAVVFTLVLDLTESASRFLKSEAKGLVGGDAAIESNFPIDIAALLDGAPQQPNAISTTLEFNGTLGSSDGEGVSVEYTVVDQAYPLYGELVLLGGDYTFPDPEELFVDKNVAEQLSVSVGDTLTIGKAEYTLRGIIEKKPDELLNTFSFFPTVLVSEAGLKRSGIDTALLRGEYTYALTYDSLQNETQTYLNTLAEENRLRLRLPDGARGGIAFGFETLTRFLVVAVLVTALLAAVNVYASTTFLLTRLRRSIAVLRSLGLSGGGVRAMVGSSFLYIIGVGLALGIGLGNVIAEYARSYLLKTYSLPLPSGVSGFNTLLVVLIVFSTALVAIVPTLERVVRQNPKELLLQGFFERSRNNMGQIALLSLIALLPFCLLASYLLGGFVDGAVTILIVMLVYVGISALYRLSIEGLYRVRSRFSFSLQSIVAQKRFDGLFGVVSFTSLFIALVSLFVLGLSQASIQTFLTDELGDTIPSLYVIDVQEAQAEALRAEFPELTLFPNIGGRVLQINDLNVQEALQEGREGVDRELRREFNLTYRTDLLDSERIVAGTQDVGVPGEVSIDEEFGERVGIALGDRVVFLIQGFELQAEVTSVRETDSRSGLPFFYFVLSPQDIEQFPATYFGYAYTDSEGVGDAQEFLATRMPNVSSIDTTEVRAVLADTVGILLAVVFYVALPSFMLATALIVVLIILQYGNRRRDSARLLAIGATPRWIQRHYLVETVSTTVLACLGAYLISLLATWYVALFFLELDVVTFINGEIIFGAVGIIGGMLLLGFVLWRTDTRPLRDLLSYEDNH